MRNKAVIALLALVIAASGCVSSSDRFTQVHDDTVQFLEDQDNNKAIIGVIAGETQESVFDVRKAQWKDYHDYTPSYYCFDQDDTEYCQFKEEHRNNGEY